MNDSGAMSTCANLPKLNVKTEAGPNITYRDTGGTRRPVVLLQHFRGNLDSWDPALIDALAVNRQVITFDYEGVGGSESVASHAIAKQQRAP